MSAEATRQLTPEAAGRATGRSARRRRPLNRQLLVGGAVVILSVLVAGLSLVALTFAPALAGDALAALEKAVIKVPQSEEGWYNWGNQLAVFGQDEKAVEALRRSIDIRPTKTAFEGLAKVLDRLGKTEDAAEARRMAERLAATQSRRSAVAGGAPSTGNGNR